MEDDGALSPVLYVCVARKRVIISQYLDNDPALAAAAAESLASLPELHKRFTFASNNRMACYSISPALTFCGIFEESFGRDQGFAFLRRVEDEFRRMLLLRGFAGEAVDIPLENMPADRDFLPVLRSMVSAANGSQTDDESADDSAPLMWWPRGERRLPGGFPFGLLTRVKSSSGKKPREHDAIMLERMADDETSSSQPSSSSSSSSSKKMLVKAPGSSSPRLWWCNMKFILAVDLVVCIVLGIVWLLFCRGFSCSS